MVSVNRFQLIFTFDYQSIKQTKADEIDKTTQLVTYLSNGI